MDVKKEMLRLANGDQQEVDNVIGYYKIALLAISKLEKGEPLNAADEEAMAIIKNGIQAVINDCETQPKFVIHKKE